MTSKAGYWIGGGLIVVAVIGAILWAVVSGASVVSTVDDFQRVAVPGERTLQLEPRKYVIYVEGPGADNSTPAVEIVVADSSTGRRLPIGSYSTSLTYSFDTAGSAYATVTPPRAGAYEVRTDAADPPNRYTVALGDSIGGKIVRAIVGAIVIGGVFGIAGVVLLIVTGVRRSRRRQPPQQDLTPPPAA